MILLEYQNIKRSLQKPMFQMGLKKSLWLKKVKSIVLWTYVIQDLKGKEIFGRSYEKELPKANQKEFRVKKVIKRKDDKLCAKWKGYHSSFNSWIDKKTINEWIFSRTEIFKRKSENWFRFA